MPNDFLNKVKAKYPAYKDIPDDSLAQMLLSKYPQYKDQLPEYAGGKAPESPTLAQSAENLAPFSPQGAILGTAISNFPESAANFAGNVANVFTHPVQTAENIGRLLWAGLKIGPSGMGGDMQDRATLQPLVEDMMNRYGGIDNAVNTFKTDPVGFMADVSTVLGGAGGAMKAAGTGGKMAEVGSAVSKAGAMIDPIAGPLGAVKSVLPLESAAKKLYQSAVKPSTTLKPAERAAVVETGLTHQIVPSEAGYLKLHELISDLNAEILNETSKAAKQGVTLDTKAIVSRIDDVENYFKNDIDPKPHLRELDNLRKRFLAQHGKTIPIDEAQKMKQTAGSILRKAYGEMKPAMMEGKKSLVRGLKEEIAAALPSVQERNAIESGMLRLEPFIAQAAGRIENLNLMSLSSPLTGAVFAASAKSPSLGIKAMIIREIIDNPRFKARMAFVLNKAGKSGVTGSKLLTPAGVGGRALPPTESPEE